MVNAGKIENIYLWGTKTAIFLVPFLPLYVSSSMLFPYITGKNFAFRILVEIAAVFWIGLIVLKKNYRLNSSAIVLSILTFALIVGIADLFGVNPYKSFWSNYERMEGYITILHLTVYFMIIRSILQTRKDRLLFFNIIFAVSLLVSLLALTLSTATTGTRFWMEYGTRVFGTVGNPPFLAAYLLLAIFVGFVLSLNTQKKILKIFYIFVIFLNAVVLYLTATRGAILSGFAGLIIMILVYIYATVKKQNWRSLMIALIAGLFVIAFTIVMLYKNDFSSTSTTFSRFASISSDHSVKSRLDSWKMAWNGIKQKPLLGWGQENFNGIYKVNPIPFNTEQIWADRAHNIVIEWLINAGVLGLLSYIAVLGSAAYTVRKKYIKRLISKNEAVTIITALIVYFLQNLFTFDTINSYFIFFALIAYIDAPETTDKEAIKLSEKNTDTKKTGMRSLGLMFSALLGVSIIFYYINYRPMVESKRILQISTSTSNYRSFSALLEDFKSTLALNTFGDNEVIARMGVVANDYILSYELFREEGAVEFLKATVIELEKGISKNYYDLDYITRLIDLYQRISFYEPAFIHKAESLTRWGISVNPGYEWLYYALADTYKLKKEYSKMLNIVNNMVALDPRNDQKQLKLALTAIFLKKGDTVTHALMEIKNIRGASNAEIISGRASFLEINELYLIAQAYIEAQNYQEAINYLSQVVAVKPNSAKLHYELANAHLNLGNKTDALKEIKKAAVLDPSTYGGIAENIDLLNK